MSQLVFGNIISFVATCCVICGLVKCESGGSENTQTGFTLKHFTDAGLVLVQCNCQHLPKDIKKIFSIDLKYVVSTSDSRPIASLYQYGECTS